MNVAFLQHNPGGRTGRIARALTELGHTCTLLTRAEPRLFNECWASVTRWESPEEFLGALNTEAFLSADIWHCHLDLVVEWIAPLASKVRSLDARKKPRIILDARDIRSMVPRNMLHDGSCVTDELCSYNEIASFQCADGVVHVSDCCHQHAEHLGLTAPQVMVLQNMPSLNEWGELPSQRSGLVYSGGLSEPPRDGSNDYRNWAPETKALAGFPEGLHIYPADQLGRHRDNAYRMRGAIVHERVADADLVRTLSRYKWGMVGFPITFPLGEAASPNKLWEYIAAGVVPCVLNCYQAASLVRQHDCGLWAHTTEELLAKVAAADYERLYGNVLKLRSQSTMEQNAPRLVSLYKRACSRGPRAPQGVWYSATGSVFDYARMQYSRRLEFAEVIRR